MLALKTLLSADKTSAMFTLLNFLCFPYILPYVLVERVGSENGLKYLST